MHTGKVTSPGWWLPTLAVGGTAVGVKGVTTVNAMSTSRTLCHGLAALNAVTSRLTGVRQGQLSCSSLDAKYHLWLELALGGLAVAIIGGIGLARRSSRAARAGDPWPWRRATNTAAAWIDARLPGRRRTQPRLRAGYITALAVLLAAVAVGAAQSAVRNDQRTQQLHSYDTAQRALTTLTLPGVIERKSSISCGSPICGYSRLKPAQLEPILARLLAAAPDTSLERILPCPVTLTGHCPTLLRGQLQGYPIVADISWHLVVVTHGRPPEGSTPLPDGHGHLFLFGSDINVSAVEPNIDS